MVNKMETTQRQKVRKSRIGEENDSKYVCDRYVLFTFSAKGRAPIVKNETWAMVAENPRLDSQSDSG